MSRKGATLMGNKIFKMSTPVEIFKSTLDLMSKLANGSYMIEVHTPIKVYLIEKQGATRYVMDIENAIEFEVYSKTVETPEQVIEAVDCDDITGITMLMRFNSGCIHTYVLV